MPVFWEFFTFELRFRLKSVSTYVYFGLWLLFSFLCVASQNFGPVGFSGGKVLLNSGYANSYNDVGASLFGTIIIAAVFGTSILRDFQRDTYQLIFTKPISKFAYLGGRWAGSFVTTVSAFPADVWHMAGHSRAVGRSSSHRPESSLELSRAFPFHPGHPDLLSWFALLHRGRAHPQDFRGLSTGRSRLHVLPRRADYLRQDPFPRTLLVRRPRRRRQPSLHPSHQILDGTAERHAWNFAGDSPGVFLFNRLLWFGVGLLSLVIAWAFFPMSVEALAAVSQGRKAARARQQDSADTRPRRSLVAAALPQVHRVFGISTSLAQYRTLTSLRIRTITREIPFWAIVALIVGFSALNGSYAGQVGNENVWPVTYLMVGTVEGNAFLFLIIVGTLYAAELIWRERDNKFDGIHDALPMHETVDWLSKFTAIAFIDVVLLLATMIIGILYRVLVLHLRGAFDRPFHLVSKAPRDLYSIYRLDHVSHDREHQPGPDRAFPRVSTERMASQRRRYFEYSMGSTHIADFFNFVSASYKVRKDQYTGAGGSVSIEVYYDPAHTHDLDDMVASSRAGLDYDQAHFSPYQFAQYRIMEFPRYRGFAQSFPNTVPFSESIGFIGRMERRTSTLPIS